MAKKSWDHIKNPHVRRQYQKWFPHQHYVISGWDGNRLATPTQAVKSACGLTLLKYYYNGSVVTHDVTCEQCKRTHKYRNDLLKAELMS